MAVGIEAGSGTYQSAYYRWTRSTTDDERLGRCFFQVWQAEDHAEAGRAPLFEVDARISRGAHDREGRSEPLEMAAFDAGLAYLHRLLAEQAYRERMVHRLLRYVPAEWAEPATYTHVTADVESPLLPPEA